MRRQPMSDSGDPCKAVIEDSGQKATDFRILDSRSGSGMGPFLSLLPTEILFELMSYLPLSDVGNLALASNQLRNIVAQWIPSVSCLKRTQLMSDNPSTLQPAPSVNGHPQPVQNILEMLVKDHFKGSNKLNPFAVLIKRMTCLHNTRGRLRYAFQMFTKSVEFKTNSSKGHKRLQSEKEKNREWEMTESTIRFMGMVHTFVRGWDETEFPLILCELDRKFRLGDKGRKVMCAAKKEEACLATEMELRMYTRCLAWDLAGNDYGHRAAWLLALMEFFVGSKVVNKDHVVRGQATLLTLMFGPACEDNTGHYGPGSLTHAQKVVINELNNHTDWSAFTETVAEDFHTGKAMFYGLAQAVCSCLSASPAWKEGLACRVVDKLFVTPRPWLIRNISGFLLFCSESLILHYFGTKLKDESGLKAVATRLADMILVSHKFDNELSHERGIGKVFDTLIRHHSDIKSRLATEVWSQFANIVEDEEDDDIDPLEIMRCFGEHVMETLAATAKVGERNGLTAIKMSSHDKKHPSSPMEASEQPQVKKAKLEEGHNNWMEQMSFDLTYSDDSEPEVSYQIED